MSDFDTLKENTLVSAPCGSFSFGSIPQMPAFGLPGGEVYLRVGVHKGENKGFGVRHIWEAYRRDLFAYGCTTIMEVPAHLARMIVPGAAIYCEFREMRGQHRLAVVKTPKGSVILEPRYERRGFGYYVVTWYPKRRLDGTLVGRVCRAPSRE